MKLKAFNSPGTLEVKFPKKKFSSLALAQTIKTQINNKRFSGAHSKTRADVRGGGAKPWRQKGTGRARHGSSSSPIWVGGGKSFGPSNQKNYQANLNSKIKKLSLKYLLRLFAENKSLYVAEKFEVSSAKTKDAAKLLRKYRPGSIAIISEALDEKTRRALANIPDIRWYCASGVCAGDLYQFSKIIISQKSLEKILNR